MSIVGRRSIEHRPENLNGQINSYQGSLPWPPVLPMRVTMLEMVKSVYFLPSL